MQPLNRTYFKSLESTFNTAADHWIVTNPGKRLCQYDIAVVFGSAFLRSATANKAVNGFRSCGLWPYDHMTQLYLVTVNLTEEEAPGSVNAE